jgi:hypothetical protein
VTAITQEDFSSTAAVAWGQIVKLGLVFYALCLHHLSFLTAN